MEKTALNDVSFNVNKGESIGVIGVSGSGKSTLAQLLNGILVPSEGEIFIDGKKLSLNKEAIKTVRKKVGLVMQFPEDQFFEETVYKDVAFGAKMMNLSEHEIEIRMKEIFKLLNLDYETIYDRSPFKLSGGEKRKVALAGIFIMNPEVLVLDEPTAGLDYASLKETNKYLKKIRYSKEKTMVLISHNIKLIAEVCDKVLVLKDGAEVFFGSVDLMLKQNNILINAGFCLPPITGLMKSLIDKGINVRGNIYNSEEASEELIKLL